MLKIVRSNLPSLASVVALLLVVALLTSQWTITEFGFSIAHIGLAAMYCYVIASGGLWLLRRLGFRTEFAFPVGFLFLGLAHLVGVEIWGFPQVFLLGTLLLFFIPEVLSGFPLAKSILGFRPSSAGELRLLCLFSGLLVWNLGSSKGLGALYPPTRCDLSIVHLSTIKTYLQNSDMTLAWWIRAPFLPMVNHMNFMSAMNLFNNLGFRADLAPGLLSIFIFIASVFGIACLVKNRIIALIFGCLALSTSLVRFNLSTSYMDLPESMFIIYFLLACLIMIEQPQVRSAVMVGLMAGAAFAAKQMSVYYMAAFVVWAPIYFVQKNGFRPRLIAQLIAVCCGFAGLVFVVTFFRNFRLTGSFLFPFYGFREPNVFKWDLTSAQGFADFSYWRRDGSFSWFSKAIAAVIQEAGPFCDERLYTAGPLFFLGLMIGPVTARWHERGGRLSLLSYLLPAVVLFNVLIWFRTTPVIRYLLPTDLFALVLVAIAFWSVRGSKSKMTLLSIVTVTFAVFNSWVWVAKPRLLPPPMTSSEIDQYLAKVLGDDQHVYEKFRGLDPQTLIYTYGGSCDFNFYSGHVYGDWFGYDNYWTFSSGKAAPVQEMLRHSRVDYVVERMSIGLPHIEDLIHNGLQCLIPVPEMSSEQLHVFKYAKDDVKCAQPAHAVTDEIRAHGMVGGLFDFSKVPRLF